MFKNSGADKKLKKVICRDYTLYWFFCTIVMILQVIKNFLWSQALKFVIKMKFPIYYFYIVSNIFALSLPLIRLNEPFVKKKLG